MKREICILVVLALISARLYAGEIEVHACAVYPPYSYAVVQAGKSVPSGLDSEIVQAVFTRMQRVVQTKLLGCRGLWGICNKPSVQCSYQWPTDINITGIRVGPLRSHRVVLATRQNGPLTSWEKLDDLKPHSIGVIAGYVYDNYGPFYEAQDLQRTEFYFGVELLAGLRDRKVDAVVGELCALVWDAKKLGILDKLKILPKTLYEDGRYIIFNDKEKELAEEFQKSLDEFKKTDEYAGILKKWETGAYEVQETSLKDGYVHTRIDSGPLVERFFPTAETPRKVRETTTKDGILRINCGGEAFTDAAGHTWQADREFRDGAWGAVGGKVVTRETKPVIGTKTEAVYQTERYGLSGYRIPLKNGTYKVTLHFAETYDKTSTAGERVFSVTIEGRKCLEAFDPFKEAGGKAWTAVVREFDIEVQDGDLAIEFASDKQVQMINGIEVVHAQ